MHKRLCAIGAVLLLLAVVSPGQTAERTVLFEMFTNTS